jgi:S-DNA-T family DNA segregation ATPase FtsK/SpoIIIE
MTTTAMGPFEDPDEDRPARPRPRPHDDTDGLAKVVKLPGAASHEVVQPGPGDLIPADRNLPGQLFDTSYEAHLDDEDEWTGSTHKPIYVDVIARDHERQPIIPAMLRPENLLATLKWWAGRQLYRLGYHGVRLLPVYLPLALFWAFVGVFKLAGRQIKWWWLDEHTPMRREAANNNDPDMWVKLHKEGKSTRRWRFFVLVMEALGTAVAIALLWFLAPWWAQLLAAAAAVCGLAHIGRPVDRPIISAATVTARFRSITADVVLRAYYAAGLGHPDKPNKQIMFGSQMSRDANNMGSQVVVDVPFGTTFAQVMARREQLASGLDVTEYQVFLTKDKTSNRRHTLFVADKNPLAIPAGRTPLLDCKPRDIWTPALFGLDERGRKVLIDLMWKSILVGAQPRKGKTFSARLLALHAALDPYVLIDIVDGKNSPDWQMFRLVANSLILGTHPSRDGDPIEQLLYLLRDIKRDIQSRNDKLRSLPVSICPEGKLTREIARDKRLGMPVRLLVIEEFQVYFETEDQDVNKEIANLLAFIISVGPSAGIILESASQKPSGVGAGDVARLFNRFRDNHAVRFALRCGNRVVSEAVLGGEAYAEGFDASSLPVGDEFRGIGYLYGLTDDTPTVRTYLADAADAEKICHAARKLREQAGTLTGIAAGEQVTITRRDPLADVAGVFGPGEAHLSWQRIAARLADRLPEAYAELTPDAISAQIRAFGVESKNVKEAGQVLKGPRIEHIRQAMGRRDR